MKNIITKITKYFFVLLIPCLASATTLVYKGLNELVNEADGILVGQVTGVESYYDRENDISTLVYLNVLDVIAGQYDMRKKDPFVINQKGGKIGNEVYLIDGSPEFTEGDRVVVFLKDNGTRRVPFVGWDQGVYKEKYFSSINSYGIVDAHGKKVREITENVIVKEKKNVHNDAISGDIFPGYQDDDKSVDSPVQVKETLETVFTTQQFVEELKSKVKSTKVKLYKDLKSFDRYTATNTATAPNKQKDAPAIENTIQVRNEDLIFNENETTLPKRSKSLERIIEIR